MTIDVKYTAQAQAQGGRDGDVATADGALGFKPVIPRELDSSGASSYNKSADPRVSSDHCRFRLGPVVALRVESKSQRGHLIWRVL